MKKNIEKKIAVLFNEYKSAVFLIFWQYCVWYLEY